MEGRVWPQERRWEAASGPPPAQRGSLRPREEKALAQGHTALMRQPLSGSRKLGSAMGCDTGWPPPSLSLVSCSAGLPPCPDCVGPFASGTSALPGWVESRKTLGAGLTCLEPGFPIGDSLLPPGGHKGFYFSLGFRRDPSQGLQVPSFRTSVHPPCVQTDLEALPPSPMSHHTKKAEVQEIQSHVENHRV